MNLALFDFDGTITAKDTFTDFMQFSVSPVRRMVGSVALAPLMLAYRAGWISACRARPMAARIVFARQRVTGLRELGSRYATEILPAYIRPQALERIRWHQLQNDQIVVVSASLDLYLRPWCDRLGIELICTLLEERHGKFTGCYIGGDCSGPEKALRIRSVYDLAGFSEIFAYGDTSEDYEMLLIAHHRYFRWQELRRKNSDPE